MNQSLSNADCNFILQQGLPGPGPAGVSALASALLFQPSVVGVLAVIGAVTQRAEVFAWLAALLWWSALLPRWNPFELLYRATLGHRAGAPELPPAPAPRRFAQGMAGTFALAITLSLLAGQRGLGWILQGVFFAALAALLFGRLCLGSFIYHLLRGNRAFAVRTLPWRRAT